MNLRPHVIVMMMMTMFAPHVMTVDPMVSVLRPMARHPDHFVFAFPVTRTMTVVRPVTDFDAKSLRLRGGPESEARDHNRDEQQDFVNQLTNSDQGPLEVPPEKNFPA